MEVRLLVVLLASAVISLVYVLLNFAVDKTGVKKYIPFLDSRPVEFALTTAKTFIAIVVLLTLKICLVWDSSRAFSLL